MPVLIPLGIEELLPKHSRTVSRPRSNRKQMSLIPNTKEIGPSLDSGNTEACMNYVVKLKYTDHFLNHT